jgi:hypothetical protein
MTGRSTTLLFLVAIALAACGSRPTSPSFTTPTPVPNAQPRPRLTGTVFEVTATGRQPLSGASVNLEDSLGDTQNRGFVQTDANGRFTVGSLTDGRAALWAFKAGYVQPCAVTVVIAGDTERDIEVISASSVDQQTIARLQDYGPAILTGTVFAATPQGRMPLSDVSVGLEIDLDFVNAVTHTDAAGRYVLCNIPPAVGAIFLERSGDRSSTSAGAIDFRLSENRNRVEKDIEVEMR